jgi:tetratricopeptide (TPR) repeat protein
MVRHLLTGCLGCTERLGTAAPFLFSEESGPGHQQLASSEEIYEQAIDRALDSARQFRESWAQQRTLNEEVLSLLRANPEMGLAAIPDETRREGAFGWPMVEALLKLSFEERFRDPKRMASLAHLACSIADTTEESDYPLGFVADLRARALTELANAYRVQEYYSKAEETLALAHERFEEGTQDQLLLGLMLEVEASLCRDQRRLPDALALLTRAYDLYQELGESHLAGRALVSKGLALFADREPVRSVQCLQEALGLLDHEADSQLVKTASQALLVALVDCQQYRKAGELLLESGLRQAFASEPLNLLRLRWVEGQIHAGLGRLSKAEHALQEVRTGFRDHDLEYDAALAGLDLAAVWLRQGKVRKVHHLASQMLTAFRVVGVQAEAFKALQLLETSCEERAVTLRIVQGVRVFLDRLQFEPHLTVEEGLVL